jgi:hypothetical protein
MIIFLGIQRRYSGKKLVNSGEKLRQLPPAKAGGLVRRVTAE